MTIQAFLLWVLLALSTARLTRLVADDHWPPSLILRDTVRKWGKVRAPKGPKHWDVFIHCPWCVSVWIGAGVYSWAWYLVDIPYPIPQYLAGVMVAGAIGSRFGD